MRNKARNTGNAYARAIANYRAIPKSVFAAVAASFAVRIEETTDPDSIEFAIIREWQNLRHNGIVPQRVRIPRAVLTALAQRELFPQEIAAETGPESGISTVSTGVHRQDPPV